MQIRTSCRPLTPCFRISSALPLANELHRGQFIKIVAVDKICKLATLPLQPFKRTNSSIRQMWQMLEAVAWRRLQSLDTLHRQVCDVFFYTKECLLWREQGLVKEIYDGQIYKNYFKNTLFLKNKLKIAWLLCPFLQISPT